MAKNRNKRRMSRAQRHRDGITRHPRAGGSGGTSLTVASALDSDVLGDPDRTRSDCAMAARLIGMGVVPTDKVASLISRGADLADNATSPREYASAMRVLLAGGRLELDAQLAEQRSQRKPSQHVHLHEAPVVRESSDLARERATELARISRKLGLPEVADKMLSMYGIN